MPWRDAIQRLFKNGDPLGDLSRDLGGSATICATKMESKPTHSKGGTRPTYSCAAFRRLILRCVTSSFAMVCRRVPHSSPNYSSKTMFDFHSFIIVVQTQESFKTEMLNLDVSGWSPGFCLPDLLLIYTLWVNIPNITGLSLTLICRHRKTGVSPTLRCRAGDKPLEFLRPGFWFVWGHLGRDDM